MKQSLNKKEEKKIKAPPTKLPQNFPFNNPYDQFLSKLNEQERILQNYKIITWEKHFQYSKIHINDLDSIFVKENPFFQEMISLIESYNAEVDKFNSTGDPIINGPWRSHFFVKLHNILLEIVFTKNRTLQNYFIETVHSWAMDQLSRLNGQDSMTQKASSSTQRPFTGSTNITRPQSGLPENLDQFKKSKIKRPGSAIIVQNVRPVSGILKSERPVSGAVQIEKPDQENEAGTYKYIRPLSGWNRPLSSITRPWSSTSGELIENLPEAEEIRNEEPEQEDIHEIEEEEDAAEAEEEDDIPQFNQNQLLPSQYIKSVMKDYKIGARTKIDYVDAPYERLKSYRHKNLLSESLQKQIQIQPPVPVEKPSTILYEKPVLFLQQQQKYREQKEEERKLAEAAKAAAEAEKKLKGDEEEAEEAPKKPSSFAKPAKKKRPRKKKKEYPFKASLVPDHIPYKDDDLFKIPRVQSAQAHLRNKFETKSTFLHYQPSDDPRELNMELKWFHNRNKELNDKRVDEEMVTMLKEWSSNKERIEGEIARKIQSEYDASQLKKIEYKPNLEEAKLIKINLSEEDSDEEEDVKNDENDGEDNRTPNERKRPFSSVLPRNHDFSSLQSRQVKKDFVLYDISGVEMIKAKRKVEEVRKLLGNNINANLKEDEDKGKMPKSLSIYASNNIIGEKKLKTRPFSAFIQSQKVAFARNEQMFEINEIKEKLAKHRVPTNTKVLVNALMVPEGLNDQNKLFQLPLPGSDLIKNPFAEVKKTRKRKGKGKGKKKKK